MVNKSTTSSVFGSLFQTLIPSLEAASVFSLVSSIKRHSSLLNCFLLKQIHKYLHLVFLHEFREINKIYQNSFKIFVKRNIFFYTFYM